MSTRPAGKGMQGGLIGVGGCADALPVGKMDAAVAEAGQERRHRICFRREQGGHAGSGLGRDMGRAAVSKVRLNPAPETRTPVKRAMAAKRSNSSGNGDTMTNRLLRHINEQRCLRVLRRSAPMSRADLGRELGVTRATIGNSIKVLLDARLVVETGGQEDAKRAGRPGVLVSLNAAGAYFVGLDVSTDAVNGIVLDFSMNVVACKSIPIRDCYGDVEAVTAILAELADDLMGAPGVRQTRVQGICVSIPGIVKEGHVVTAPWLGWKDAPLQEAIESRVSRRVPVLVCNDAVALASAVRAISPEEQMQDAVLILLAEGIGSAHMHQGAMVAGAHGFAGEIGHMVMGADFGCQTFEMVAGYKRFVPLLKPGEPISSGLERIAAAAPSDAAAAEATRDWGDALAVGLLNVIHMLDPLEIVLGGPLVVLYPLVEGRVNQLLAEHLVHGLKPPAIRATALGADGAAIGAASLLREDLFALPALEAS